MKLKYVNNGTPKLRIINNEGVENFSIHVWKIDNNYKNNKIRLHMSGWQSSELYDFSLEEPGKYYAQIILTNGKRYNTNQVQISYAELFKSSDQADVDNASMYLTQKSKEEYKTQKLMQKMFIVGRNKILEVLNRHLAGPKTKISMFLSEETTPLANAIYSFSFFDGLLKKPEFYSEKSLNVGYLFSMSFRSYSRPVKYTSFQENDLLIVLDENNTEAKQIILNNAREANTKILTITDLIQEAYLDKFLITPLMELSNKTVYINLPTVRGISNPSEYEKVAVHRTIKEVRNNLSKGILPEIYKGMSYEYVSEVLNGWTLENHLGFDKLKDSEGKYVNITNGHRKINNNGQLFINKTGKVMFFGNSVIYGIGSDDDHNLPSLFAKMTNIATENMANFSMNDFVRATNLIKNTDFDSEDIVIIGVHQPLNKYFQKKVGNYVDMQPYFDHPRDFDNEFFVDMTHMTKDGYKIMAQVLASKLVSMLD